jgi:hypothetical protein
VEVRALRGGLLGARAELSPDAALDLGGGSTLTVEAIVPWVDLLATYDPSRPLYAAGIAIGLAGLVLMFLFVSHDEGVFVENGRLVVALRARRFAPLFADRFEKLRREHAA